MRTVPITKTPLASPSHGRSPQGKFVAAALAASLTSIVFGCGTVKTTGTARTGTEQILLTNAWDSALKKVDFRPLTGVPVFLDTSNVTAVDQGWVVSSLREALLTEGVLLRQKPEQAQWVVEARVGAYGTDESNLLIGVSQLSVPPTITGVPTGAIPEIPFIKKNEQTGVAKLAIFAYDRASGQLVWNSGTMIAVATAKTRHVFGVGPIQSGTIRGGTDIAGIRIPLTAETEGGETLTPAKNAHPGIPAAELKQPSLIEDGESFAP